MAGSYSPFGYAYPNQTRNQEYLQLYQAHRKLRAEYARALAVLHQHEVAEEAYKQQITQLERIVQQAQARIANLQNELQSTRQEHAAQQAHDLQQNIEQAQAAAQEWQEQAARLRTEMEEQRKRQEQRVAQSVELEQRRVLIDVLPLADHLELAVQYFLQNAPADAAELAAHYRANLQVMLQAFLSTLRHYGIARIAAEAQPFDPHLHEAVGEMPSQVVPVGHVVQVVQSGYRQHDIVLRPAQVLVSSGEADSEETRTGTDTETETDTVTRQEPEPVGAIEPEQENKKTSGAKRKRRIKIEAGGKPDGI